jgi:hypothetical protein
MNNHTAQIIWSVMTAFFSRIGCQINYFEYSNIFLKSDLDLKKFLFYWVEFSFKHFCSLFKNYFDHTWREFDTDLSFFDTGHFVLLLFN